MSYIISIYYADSVSVYYVIFTTVNIPIGLQKRLNLNSHAQNRVMNTLK